MAAISPRHDQDDNLIGWQAIIRKRGFPSQTKTFRTKRDAEAWANVTESEMVRGVFVQRTESERTLLSDLPDRYAREVVPTLKGGDRDMSRIRTLKAYLGKYAVASITSALVAQYRDTRLSTISDATGKAIGPQTRPSSTNLVCCRGC